MNLPRARELLHILMSKALVGQGVGGGFITWKEVAQHIKKIEECLEPDRVEADGRVQPTSGCTRGVRTGMKL